LALVLVSVLTFEHPSLGLGLGLEPLSLGLGLGLEPLSLGLGLELLSLESKPGNYLFSAFSFFCHSDYCIFSGNY